MSPSSAPAPATGAPENAADDLAARLRDAAALLEAIVEDRALLASVPEADRHRLLQAAGRVSRPDAIARRNLVKASKRERKAERVARAEAVLTETGIRRLRA